jgi:hypothetical protein
MGEEKLDTKATPFQRDRSSPVCVTRPLIIQCEPNNVLWLPAEMEDRLPSAVREQVYPHGLFERHKQRIHTNTNDLFAWHKLFFFFDKK